MAPHRQLHEKLPRAKGVLSFILSEELHCFFEDMFESTYKNTGFVNVCSFEQGITMVCRTSACGMLESLRNYEGFVNVNYSCF